MNKPQPKEKENKITPRKQVRRRSRNDTRRRTISKRGTNKQTKKQNEPKQQRKVQQRRPQQSKQRQKKQEVKQQQQQQQLKQQPQQQKQQQQLKQQPQQQKQQEQKEQIKTQQKRSLSHKQPKKIQDTLLQKPDFKIQRELSQPKNPIKQEVLPKKQPKKPQVLFNTYREPNQVNKIKSKKLTPKIKMFTHHEKKEKNYLVNLKCSKGFERLLENSLSALFYDSKHPNFPSLKVIEHKLIRKEYKTIYDFGFDLRGIWSFYFKFYSSSPQYYQLTYNMSEYCENVINELEEMIDFPSNQEVRRIECLSIEEKEELGENIKLLKQDDLKKLIQLLDSDMMKKDGKKKLFEFDIESLPNETQMKLFKFVKRCIHHQQDDGNDSEKEEEIEMERIRKLKVLLSI